MWEFYKEVIKQFKNVGAFAPSGPALAKAMARALPCPFTGTLIELGPGTGAITKGLLQKGIHPDQIVAIEQSERFVNIMKSNYPDVCILQGSAEHLSTLIEPLNKPINAMISSLPLRSFSKEKVLALLDEIDKVLIPGGYYIQFTYSKKTNPLVNKGNYKLIKSTRVLVNFPPARVDVFKKVA